MPLKYINITCLHGIGNSPIKQQVYAAQWEQVINTELIKVQPTVQVRCKGMTWDSSGDPMRDLANVISSRHFREDQIEHIKEQVKDLYPTTSMFVCHSLGCVWMMAVLSELVLSDISIPMPNLVGIGGPMGHPLWGRALAAVGLKWKKPPVNQKPIAFWNADDGVSSFGNWYSTPVGWDSRRIELFPETNPGFKEHADHDYLSHLNFIRLLKE